MIKQLDHLKNDLSHVLWIGGTACSGKTTVARMLAQKYDLRVYHRDEHQREHLMRATPEKHPTLHKAWADRENWEALYRQPAERVFEQAKAEAFEAFDFIVDDLLRTTNAAPLIAEGIGLFPELVERVSSPQQAIYFVADEGLARRTWTDRYENTPWLEGYSDPEQIIETFISLTLLNARYIEESARRSGFTCVVSSVDGDISDAFRVAEERFESVLSTAERARQVKLGLHLFPGDCFLGE